MTDADAKLRLGGHHAALVAALQAALAELDAAPAGTPAAAAAERLHRMIVKDVVSHADGEERSLYPAGQRLDGPLMAALLDDHTELRTLIARYGETLAGTDDTEECVRRVGLAHEIVALFGAHARKEDKNLVPLLLEGTPPGTLARLFSEMHEDG